MNEIIGAYRSIKRTLIDTNEQYSIYRKTFERDFESDFKRNVTPSQEPKKADNITQQFSRGPTMTQEEPTATVPYIRHSEEIGHPVVTNPAISSKGIKKLYNKLCKMFHPDKTHSNNELFIKVQTAYEHGNNTDLLEIALEADLQLDSYIDDTKELVLLYQNQINSMNAEINTMKHSVIWIWATLKNKCDRDQLYARILTHLRKKGIL